MSKIRLGILGGGGDSLIGIVHRIASGMFDEFELEGVLDGLLIKSLLEESLLIFCQKMKPQVWLV